MEHRRNVTSRYASGGNIRKDVFTIIIIIMGYTVNRYTADTMVNVRYFFTYIRTDDDHAIFPLH